MASKKWLMQLFFMIGIPMFVIGLSLLGATLLMRKRAISRRRSDGNNPKAKEVSYSHIDLDRDIYVRPPSVNRPRSANNKPDNDKRIQTLKKSILEGKQRLQRLSSAQQKFSKLIVEKLIETHSIVDNKIVYTNRVIKNFPKLHKHLIKLHKTKNTLRHQWDELDTLVGAKKIDRSVMDRLLVQLVSNTYDKKMNRYNIKQMTKKNPLYDNNLLESTANLNKEMGEYSPLTKGDMETYLTDERDFLDKEKFTLEVKLRTYKLISEVYEDTRLNY